MKRIITIGRQCRSADYILEDREDCLNVFICGNLADRVKRVVEEHGIEDAEAEKHMFLSKFRFGNIRTELQQKVN